MKDEIKEILDKLKDGNWYEEKDLTGTMWIELRWEETHLLLDYITNLQEEYKKSCETYQQALDETMSEKMDLEKENERLKMDIRYWEDKWQYTKFSDKDYKSRNEKAIKHIKEEAVFYDSYNGEDTMLEDLCERYYKDLLNILNGDDK